MKGTQYPEDNGLCFSCRGVKSTITAMLQALMAEETYSKASKEKWIKPVNSLLINILNKNEKTYLWK